MAARLGLDTSDFLDKMKGVEGFSSASGNRIASAMKQSSREGAESLRLIDEALGVHLSRPVVRILTQEFPALAAGLQSILGAGVIGAVGFAAFEAFERITGEIKKAQQAQEEFIAAQQKLVQVQRDIGSSWAEQVNKLSFTPAQIVDSDAAGKALGQIKQIGAAIDDVKAKAAAASGTFTQAWRSLGNLFAGRTGELTRENKNDFDQLKESIESAFDSDKINGTDTALKKVNEDIAQLNAEYERVADMALLRPTDDLLPSLKTSIKEQLDYLDRVKAAEEGRQKLEAAQKSKDAAAAALEREAKAAGALKTMYGELSSTIAKLVPVTDPLEKLRLEAQTARGELENAFLDIERTATSALMLKTAQQNFEAAMKHLDQIVADEKAKIEQGLASTAVAAQFPKGLTGVNSDIFTRGLNAAPGGGPTSPQDAKLSAFAADYAEQLRMAKQAFEDTMTPLQKYQLGVSELSLLEQKGLIDDKAKSAAVAALGEQYQKAASQVFQLQDQMEKLLARGDASSGVQAFLLQTKMKGQEDGKSVLAGLTSAQQGFEESFTRSLMLIQNSTRTTGQQLLQMWEQYFASLESMVLKRGLDKIFSGLISKSSGNPADKLLASGGGAGAAAPLTAAGTTLQTAAVNLNAAALALRASGAAGAGAGGGGAAAGVGDIMSAFAGGFAEGGDVPTGMHFVAGEAGAEDISLGASGAHITPLGGRGGGDNHQYFDMRGAVVTDDLMRRAEAQNAIALSERRMMAAIPAMQREINLRKRGN